MHLLLEGGVVLLTVVVLGGGVLTGWLRHTKRRHSQAPFVKRCWRCGRLKPFMEFPASRRSPDGCQRRCYACLR